MFDTRAALTDPRFLGETRPRCNAANRDSAAALRRSRDASLWHAPNKPAAPTACELFPPRHSIEQSKPTLRLLHCSPLCSVRTCSRPVIKASAMTTSLKIQYSSSLLFLFSSSLLFYYLLLSSLLFSCLLFSSLLCFISPHPLYIYALSSLPLVVSSHIFVSCRIVSFRTVSSLSQVLSFSNSTSTTSLLCEQGSVASLDQRRSRYPDVHSNVDILCRINARTASCRPPAFAPLTPARSLSITASGPGHNPIQKSAHVLVLVPPLFLFRSFFHPCGVPNLSGVLVLSL